MQNLEDVSLVIVDCLDQFRALSAIERCRRGLKFKEILFFSDKPNGVIPTTIINKITDKQQYSYFLTKELYQYVNTKHILIVQYDGYVLNPELWTDDWLQYDYIGARWNFYHDAHNVGNGGFSLRSKRLQEILATDPHIKDVHPEDHIICRIYRDYLEEKYDIKFAPVEVADIFSDENSKFQHKTFGYHGGFRY